LMRGSPGDPQDLGRSQNEFRETAGMPAVRSLTGVAVENRCRSPAVLSIIPP